MPQQDISSYNGLFLRSAKDHIDTIENKLLPLLNSLNQNDNTEEIYRRAHSLKGSSSVMGYTEISDICNQIIGLVHPQDTEIPNDKSFDTLPDLIDSLKKQIFEIEQNNTT